MIRLGSDSTGTFDEDTWVVETPAAETVLYSGAASIMQLGDEAQLGETEGVEELHTRFQVRFEQDARFGEVRRGDVLLIIKCERSPHLNGKRLMITGESGGTLRLTRKVYAMDKPVRRQS